MESYRQNQDNSDSKLSCLWASIAVVAAFSNDAHPVCRRAMRYKRSACKKCLLPHLRRKMDERESPRDRGQGHIPYRSQSSRLRQIVLVNKYGRPPNMVTLKTGQTPPIPRRRWPFSGLRPSAPLLMVTRQKL